MRGGGSEAFGKNSYLSHIFYLEVFPYCEMCGDVFESERQLKNHQREKHDGMVLNSMGHVVHKDSMWAF